MPDLSSFFISFNHHLCVFHHLSSFSDPQGSKLLIRALRTIVRPSTPSTAAERHHKQQATLTANFEILWQIHFTNGIELKDMKDTDIEGYQRLCSVRMRMIARANPCILYFISLTVPKSLWVASKLCMTKSQRMQRMHNKENKQQICINLWDHVIYQDQTHVTRLHSCPQMSTVGYLFPANCASPTSCTLAPSLASSTTPDAKMQRWHTSDRFRWVSKLSMAWRSTRFKGFSMAMPQMHPDPNFSRNGPIFKWTLPSRIEPKSLWHMMYADRKSVV